MATPPSGYLNRQIAQSVQEALANYTVDHIKTIVKGAVQRYIESFMNQNGGNRNLYEKFTRLGLQYITDKSFDQTSDPTLRKTQLARLFEQIRQELPCILVMDSKFEYVPANFTGVQQSYFQGDYAFYQVQVVRMLDVMVVAGTRDQSSTDFLHGLLSVLFGEMRFLGGGTLMTGNRNQGETWSLTMGLPRLGKVSQNKVPEDPKDTIWFFDIEVTDMLFEDQINLKIPLQKVTAGNGVMNPSPPELGLTPPIIYFPDSMAINDSIQLRVDLFQPQSQQIYISDPNIATYEPVSRMVTPRRLGTFDIQVMMPTAQQNAQLPPGQQTGKPMTVMASKTVVVRPT